MSGRGTLLPPLFDVDDPRVVLVVSNRARAAALERAAAAGIETACVTRSGAPREDFDRRLADVVEAAAPDVILLAGFMHVLSPAFLDRFSAIPIINVHPALLPDDPRDDIFISEDGTKIPVFRGHDALEQAIAAAVPFTGSSVHFVTAEVDRGHVLARVRIPLRDADTVDSLRARVQIEEHRILREALASFAAGGVD